MNLWPAEWEKKYEDPLTNLTTGTAISKSLPCSHFLTLLCPFKGVIFTGIIPTPTFEATDITSLASWNGASQAGGLAENTR